MLIHLWFQQQQQVRINTSGATFPNELRDLLRRRLSDLENQLLTKVAELEEEKAQLYNETAAHRQRTENTLNSLLERIAELERSKASVSVQTHTFIHTNTDTYILFTYYTYIWVESSMCYTVY